MKRTIKNYIEYLNEVGLSLPENEFVIGGRLRKGQYGQLLKKYDPIAFEVGFQEWKREGR